MFKRRRLTMKEASPPPSMPAVHNVLPADHPATQEDPAADARKTGDPGDWGDTPTSGPYPNSPPPSTPGYDEAGAEHPGAKKAAEEEALKQLRTKAAKAIKLVEGMADKEASQDDMQNAAMSLLNLPEAQLDATLDTLTKLGFFTAMDMEMDEGMGDEMSAYAMKMRAMEEEIQAMKARMGMGDAPMVDESPGDDIADPNTFTGVEGMGDDVDAMYQAMVQEEAMRLAGGGKAAEDDDDDDDDEEEMDEEASKKAGALALKIHQLRQAMEEDDDESDEGKAAKKAAADAIAEAEQALAVLTAGKKSELPPEFLKQQKGKGDDDGDDDKKDDDGDDKKDDDKKDEGGDKEASAEEIAAKEAAEKEAAAALEAAAAEQGTSPDDAIVMANTGLDPMGLAGAPDIGNDDVLSLLFKTGMEDEDDDKGDEDAEAAKKAAAEKEAAAQAKTASTTPKPQPKTPSVGPDTLGSLVHTASAGGGSDVGALSSIWETKPDVSDHFA